MPVTARRHCVPWALLQGVCITLLSPVSLFSLLITLHLPESVWCHHLLARCPFPLLLGLSSFTVVGFEEERTVITGHQCTFNLTASLALFLLIFIFHPLSLLDLLEVCEFC